MIRPTTRVAQPAGSASRLVRLLAGGVIAGSVLAVLGGCSQQSGSPQDARAGDVGADVGQVDVRLVDGGGQDRRPRDAIPTDRGPVSDATLPELRVEIDLGKPLGPWRSLLGVNKNPVAGDSRTGGGNTYSAVKLYRAFGVTEARLHDGGNSLCDIYKDATILDMTKTPPVKVTACRADGSSGPPHLSWTVNDPSQVDNPANYDFVELDSAVATTLATGGAIYLRLGQNWNGPNDTGDPSSWAKVATNIYKHVIGTFKPSGTPVNPVAVEVFNEPDGMFWVGDQQVFYQLFNQTVDGVRAAATAAGKPLRIGGPGFTAEILSRLKKPDGLAAGFVAAVTPARLDFLSVHHYSDCADAKLANSASFLTSVRSEFDRLGLSGKPFDITEYNIGLGQKCGNDLFSQPPVQSFTSGLLTLMQEEAYAIERAHFYAGMPNMPLFTFSEKQVGTMVVNPSAWAFWAHARLKDGTRQTASTCSSAGCLSGVQAASALLQAAAAQAAGGATRVVVTNHGEAAQSYLLRMRGLGAARVTIQIQTPTNAAQNVRATKVDGLYEVEDSALDGLLASPTTEVRRQLPVRGGVADVVLNLAPHSLQLVGVQPEQ